jgi:catechol 2,3-dioxygenase-like lactoylglutathione lyase family enzyme
MSRIFHTGITVKKLEVSMPFYRDVLGLKLINGPTPWNSGEAIYQAVGVANTCLRLCIFEADAGGATLEILEYQTPPSPITKPMPPNAVGAMHVSFQVDDIYEKMAKMKQQGVRFYTDPVIGKGHLEGWKWVYFEDPDGIVLELIQCDPPKK